MNLSKREIILLKHRDEKMFEKVYREYAAALCCFVDTYVRNVETSKDITQDVFVNLFEYMEKYDENKTNFKTWLWAIAKNHAINYLNSLEVKCFVSLENYVAVSTQPNNSIILDLKDILESQEYDVAIYNMISEFTLIETANILGISRRTVFRRLKTATKKIKKFLEEYYL